MPVEPMLTGEQMLMAAVGALSGVILVLWRLLQVKEVEVKSLMREMLDLALEIRTHLANGRGKSSDR